MMLEYKHLTPEKAEAFRKASASADICELFSYAFMLPSEEFVSALLSGSFSQDMCDCSRELLSLEDEAFIRTTSSLIGELDRVLEPADDRTQLLFSLQAEYTRLYVVSGRAPLIFPFESAFKHVAGGHEGVPTLFISPITLDVEKQMKRLNALPENALKEPVDSMAAEMDFLRYLYTQTAHAIYHDSEETTSAWLEEILTFRKTHFDTWLDAFMERTIQLTNLPIYRIIASLARITLTALYPEKGDG